MNKNFNRINRIEQLLQRELAKIISYEVKPPSFVTISHAIVSKDLSYAKVYFTVFGSKVEETQNLLDTAAKRYRNVLSQSMNLRKMPKLKFIYDASIEYANRLSKLIDDVNKDIVNEN